MHVRYIDTVSIIYNALSLVHYNLVLLLLKYAFHTNPLHLPNVLQTSLQISLRQLYKHGLTYQVNMRQMCLYFANQYLTLGLYIKNRKNTYWVAICFVIFNCYMHAKIRI